MFSVEIDFREHRFGHCAMRSMRRKFYCDRIGSSPAILRTEICIIELSPCHFCALIGLYKAIVAEHCRLYCIVCSRMLHAALNLEKIYECPNTVSIYHFWVK